MLAFGPRPSPAVATAISTMAVALLCFGDSGYWASYVDMSPRFAGVLLGIGNCLANFAGILVNASTGYILDTATSQVCDDSPTFERHATLLLVTQAYVVLMCRGRRRVAGPPPSC